MWKLRLRAGESLAQSRTASRAGSLGAAPNLCAGQRHEDEACQALEDWAQVPQEASGREQTPSSQVVWNDSPPPAKPTVTGHLSLPSPQAPPHIPPYPSSVLRTLETLTRPLLFVSASVGSKSTVWTFLQGQTAGQCESVMDSSKLDTVQI